MSDLILWLVLIYAYTKQVCSNEQHRSRHRKTTLSSGELFRRGCFHAPVLHVHGGVKDRGRIETPTVEDWAKVLSGPSKRNCPENTA